MPNEFSSNGFVDNYIRRRRELELDKQRSEAQAEAQRQFNVEQERLKADSAERARQFALTFGNTQDQQRREQEKEAFDIQASGLGTLGARTLDPTIAQNDLFGSPIPPGNIDTPTVMPPGGRALAGQILVPTTVEQRGRAAAALDLETTKAKSEAGLKQRLDILNKIMDADPKIKQDPALVRSLTLQAHGMEDPKEPAVQTILSGYIDQYMNAKTPEESKAAITKYKLFRDFYQQDYSLPRPSASINNQQAIGKRAQDIYTTVRNRLPDNATSEQIMKAAQDVANEYPNSLNVEALQALRTAVSNATGYPQEKPKDALDELLDNAIRNKPVTK